MSAKPTVTVVLAPETVLISPVVPSICTLLPLVTVKVPPVSPDNPQSFMVPPPPLVPLAAAVIRPCASTVMSALV